MKRLVCVALVLGWLSAGGSSRLTAQTPTADAPKADAVAPTLWQPSDFYRSITWGGFVESSYTFNFNNPSDGNENGARAFDTNSNEFMLNAVVLKADRSVGAGGNVVGFSVHALAGQDAATGQAVGLFKDDAGVSDTDFDLPNAHILMYCPDLDTTVKLGKFLTPAGWEGFYSPDQWAFSRSLLWTFAIPISHTGLTFRKPFVYDSDGKTEMIAFEAGVTNGWDNVKDLNEEKMILTSLKVAPSPKYFDVVTNFFYSFSEQTTNVENARQLLDIVANIRPFADSDLSDLYFGANLDWGGEEGASGEDGRYGRWYGFAAMARYDFDLCGDGTNKNWYLAGRGEYFVDPDAARLGGLSGGEGLNIWEFTVTMGWKPWSNLLLRTELRHDHADEKIFAHKGDAADRNGQTTLGFVADFLF